MLSTLRPSGAESSRISEMILTRCALFLLVVPIRCRRSCPAPSAGTLLGSLCSNDDYGFWSVNGEGEPVAVPPFALSFSSTAMNGHALAAGDEEGIVTVLDTRRSLRHQMREPTHPRFTALDNAIFDLCWLNDDRDIATAGGDGTVRVFDVETSTRRALMGGHSGTVKSVRPCPSAPHIFLTAGRDGNILGFDLRVPAQSHAFRGPQHSAVLKIAHPHTHSVRYSMTQAIGRKRRRVQAQGPPTALVGSVTSLVFSPTNHAQLFSSGASDGAVKLWDMRCLRSATAKANGASFEEDKPVASVVPGNELRRDDPYKSGRPHGIANVDIDATGKHLLVSSTDSSIYTYNAHDIQLGYERVLTGHTQTSFYIRACFSPDGNFVLSGSADSKAYMWDLQQRAVDGALSPILELAGHRAGEASAVDWCKTDLFKVATGGDDSTAKLWTLGTDRKLDAFEQTELGPTTLRASAPALRQRPRRMRRSPGGRGNNRTKFREQDIRSFFTPAREKASEAEGLYASSSPVSSFDGSEDDAAAEITEEAAITFDESADGELMSLEP